MEIPRGVSGLVWPSAAHLPNAVELAVRLSSSALRMQAPGRWLSTGLWAGCRSSSAEPAMDGHEEGEGVVGPEAQVRERDGRFEDLVGGHPGDVRLAAASSVPSAPLRWSSALRLSVGAA